MNKVLGREPILLLAAVQTAVALVAAFGLSLSAEQVAAVTAFAAAVLGVLARSKVTPAASVEAAVSAAWGDGTRQAFAAMGAASIESGVGPVKSDG